jgi:hypothetical protein
VAAAASAASAAGNSSSSSCGSSIRRQKQLLGHDSSFALATRASPSQLVLRACGSGFALELWLGLCPRDLGFALAACTTCSRLGLCPRGSRYALAAQASPATNLIPHCNNLGRRRWQCEQKIVHDLGGGGGYTTIKRCKSVDGDLCSGGNMIACRTEVWLWSLANAVDVGGWQRICKRPGNHVKKRTVRQLNEWYRFCCFL